MNIDGIEAFVKEQFPDFYASEGPRFIAFVEAYYAWVSTTTNTRDFYTLTDIDTTLDEFVTHYKDKYLSDFSLSTSVDIRTIIKKSSELFGAKGGEKAIKLFFQLLYGQDVNIYYPGNDVIRASDGQWTEPKYIECTLSPIAKSLIGTRVIGSISKASANIESCVRKRVDGKLFDVYYISQQDGTFIRGERISGGGQPVNIAPIVQGSLIDVQISNGGSGFRVGDRLTVESNTGIGGIVRVSRIESRTGLVDFSIIDGGSGFFANTPVIVSTVNFQLDSVPPNLSFPETVTQELEQVGYNTSNGTPQFLSVVTGRTAANVIVGTGLIVSSNGTNIVVDVSNGSFSTADILSANGFSALTSSVTDISASSLLVGANQTIKTLGVANVINTFYYGGILHFQTANATASILEIKTGEGAAVRIGALSGAVTEDFYTTRLNARNTGNVQFSNLTLNGTNSGVAANGYGFPLLPSSNINTVLGNALTKETFTSGRISSFAGINPGAEYNIGPFVRIFNGVTYPYTRTDISAQVLNASGAFLPYEQVSQTIVAPGQTITYANATGSISVGDVIKQTSSNGIATVISANSTVLNVRWEVPNPFVTGTFSIPKANATANAISLVNSSSNVSWSGILLSRDQDIVQIRPLSITTTLNPAFPIIGQVTGTSANLTFNTTETSSSIAGDNADILTIASTTNGSIATVQIIDSGFSFTPLENVNLRLGGNEVFAVGETIINGEGKAKGFFASETGSLDQVGAIHDNNYYQAYSYELQSSLPIDTYRDVFTKTMHKAGFALFGKVVQSVNIPTRVTASTPEITLT